MKVRVIAIGFLFSTVAATVAGCTGAAEGQDTPAPRATTQSAGSAPGGAECAPDVLLAVAGKALNNPVQGVSIEKVEVISCRNGYARIVAIPQKGAYSVVNEQLVLEQIGGSWRVIDHGTSLDCRDKDLQPDTAAACRALG